MSNEVSRRRFLAGTAATAGGALIPAEAASAAESRHPASTGPASSTRGERDTRT